MNERLEAALNEILEYGFVALYISNAHQILNQLINALELVGIKDVRYRTHVFFSPKKVDYMLIRIRSRFKMEDHIEEGNMVHLLWTETGNKIL